MKKLLSLLCSALLLNSNRLLSMDLQLENPCVEQFLHSYFDNCELEHISIVPLDVVNEEIFLIKTQCANYILRQIRATSSDYIKAQEFYMIQEAAERGLAPKIYATSAEHGLILMEYIEGKTLSMEEAELHCYEIGQTIRKIHMIPPHPTLTHTNTSYAQHALWRYNEIKERLEKGHYDPKLVERIAHDIDLAMNFFLQDLEEIDQMNLAKCMIHNDLHAKNLLWTEDGLKMLDWDGTDYASPYFDLAFFMILQKFSPEEEACLLEGYFGCPATCEEIVQIDMAKKMFFSLQPLICYRIALVVQEKCPTQSISLNEPLKSWTNYMVLFSTNETAVLPAQYYYDSARFSSLRSQKMHE